MTLVVAALLLAALAVGLRWLREAAVLRRKHSGSKVVWSDFRSETLGPYYFPNSVDPGGFAEFDENGVRVVDFSKKPTIGKTGRQYVISAIDQYGLGSWDLWLATREPARLDAVRRQADWLVANQTVDGDGVGTWLHRYDVGGEHRVQAPWISGLAQGMSISLLLRAWQATGHEPYREACARALRSFGAPVGRGGVRAADEAGRTFYEEVPSDPPRHILNGHVYALLGIHDYFRVTRSTEVAALFEAGAGALRANLPRYDTGGWSRYSLTRKRTLTNHFALASPQYHRLHIDMLRVLHSITGERAFQEQADRWERCLGGPFDLGMRLAYAAFRDLVLCAKRVGLRP
jgi:hypothetical protein